MTIDATIQRLTNDGEVVVQFLVDVIQGISYNAPLGHRIKSAEWLAMFGRLIPESAIPKYASVRPRPKSEPKPAKTDKPDKLDKLDKKPKVTEKQILHFDIARLIKQETNDGETIIEFLIRVISKIEETGENFTPAVRMRAAKELLIRGFGSTIPGVRRILSGKTEELDSYLSKIVREYTNYGADSIRFLVETMENKDPEADSRGAASFIKLMRMRPRIKPAEGFTASGPHANCCAAPTTSEPTTSPPKTSRHIGTPKRPPPKPPAPPIAKSARPPSMKRPTSTSSPPLPRIAPPKKSPPPPTRRQTPLTAPPADAKSATLAKPKSAPSVSNPPLPRISPPSKKSPRPPLSSPPPPTGISPPPTRRQPTPATRAEPPAAAKSAPPAKPKNAPPTRAPTPPSEACTPKT